MFGFSKNMVSPELCSSDEEGPREPATVEESSHYIALRHVLAIAAARSAVMQSTSARKLAALTSAFLSALDIRLIRAFADLLNFIYSPHANVAEVVATS
jgi:hypothetical protein